MHKVSNTYHFKGVIVNPDGKHKLIVNGKPLPLMKLQIKLLMYFIENRNELKSKNEILDAVWGPGEHTHDALNGALNKLRKKLPANAQIDNEHGRGYIFRHDVVVKELRFKKLEHQLHHSPRLKAVIALLSIFTTAIVAHSAHGVYRYINPIPQYRLDVLRPMFTRDHVVGTAKFSPDKRFIAHRMTRHMFVSDYLGLHDLTRGDSRPLVKLHFLAGFKWNLTGDKLLYQNMLDGQCELRLISFYDEDKTDFSDQLLTTCDKASGSLSFAWFNDKEFYVNFTNEEGIKTPNGLPLHHLYSFNIDTKKRMPLAKADYQGVIGFFSFEYDQSTDTLYFLQATKDSTTRLYKYHNAKLTELKHFDYQVRFFTVADDRLIYKNKQQHFVINSPADDFDNQQLLLKPRLASLNQPHLLGDKLVYVAGDAFGAALHQWRTGQSDQGQLTPINIQRFKPHVLASYNNQLVFTAKQTGSYQLYLLDQQQQIKPISAIANNQYIQHVAVAGDLFVLSYFNKVDIYKLVDGLLQFRQTLPHYNRGVLSPDGSKLLLTKADKAGNIQLVEKQLSAFYARGKTIPPARLSFYHNNDIIQLNDYNELLRLTADGTKELIASAVNIGAMTKFTTIKDKLYYLDNSAAGGNIHCINLNTGNKTTINVGNINPTKIQAIGERLYLRSPTVLEPTLMIGDLTLSE